MHADEPSRAILEPSTPDPRSISAPPAGWETTRESLHALAEDVIAPARYAVDATPTQHAGAVSSTPSCSPSSKTSASTSQPTTP